MDNETQQSGEKSPASTLASTAKTAASAVTAAAKASAGDVAGAITTLAKDENIRKAIAAIILGFVFLSLFGSMVMGSALTGTIEDLRQGYLEEYNDLYEEHAIMANGSTFALYTFDHQQAQEQAMYAAIANAVRSLFRNETKYSNKHVDGAESTKIENEAYDTTMQAVKDKEALVGDNGALRKRLEMIQGRVKQRGDQISSRATFQYEVSALGLTVGAYLENIRENPILFAGIDMANSSLNVNTKAFELSDIQALKILAAYSIQNDCNLSDIDMWDLMNYCGWYDLAQTSLPQETDETIYDTSIDAQFGMEIGGVVQEGQALNTSVVGLAPPDVPAWKGSCAAQWYYEQIAQLRENNETYEHLEQTGDTEALENMIHYTENGNGDILISRFDKLSNYDTFGLVDQIYTSTTANIVFSRTEYQGAGELAAEALAKLSGSLRTKWEELFGESRKYTDRGSVKRDANGNHSYTLYTNNTNLYYITRPSTGWQSSTYRGRANSSITYSKLSPNAYYEVYEVSEVTEVSKASKVSKGPKEPESTKPTTTTKKVATRIDSFRTSTSGEGYEAYLLQVDVNINYGSRSVDNLVANILGLWPGSLENTEEGSDGVLYAEGYAGNPLLAKNWTDTYTDPNGTAHTVEFTRQSGYQKEAYQDYVLAVAELLGISTAGLFGSDYGFGETIVEIAMAEYEYYHANGLYEGGRYWDMVAEATGARYPADTAWCVCFIMTCAWQAGLLGAGNAWEGVDWIYYCTGLYNELVNSGVASGYSTPGNDYKPVPGDIVFFAPTVTNNGLHHVGLVKEVTEDGKLITLEGNKSNILKMDTYSSYRLGSHAYSDCVIAAYCHPTYPATFLQDPLYEKVLGGISPSVSARIVGNSGTSTFVAGLGRFRWSQIPAVLQQLKKSYPELYSEQMQTAYEAGNQEAFLKAWNAVANSSKKQTFKNAQRRILNTLYAKPIISTIRSQTGFDWGKTTIREQLLLGIITTTDQHSTCISILKAMQGSFNNNVSDNDLLNYLNTNNYLHNLVSSNRDLLWPGEPEIQKKNWCTAIQRLLKKVTEQKEELSSYTLDINVTHYCACKICCGSNASGHTASGKRVAEGMIATSSYYPFGTKFRINGILYTVEDRGGYEIENSIHRVDIYVPDHNQALKMGRYNTTAIIYPAG